MTATILRGDARALPIADASVDLIVTSPPYFALRSYTDGGEHYTGQIGAEATPQEYIAALIDCTREWMRVLKPGGSIWVNLGDKYNSAQSGQNGATLERTTTMRKLAAMERRGSTVPRYPTKSLMMLPERYRIACVDELGLIARAVVVWSKPNGLPESVTDRVRRSHEDWVHLTKQPRYFSAVDEIRQPHADPFKQAGRNALNARNVSLPKGAAPYGGPNSLGALPGSVWEIPTEPLTVPAHLGVDHFAAFPTEWPRRIILGWSPSGICVECGEGRRPAADHHEKYLHRPSGANRVGVGGFDHDDAGVRRDRVGNVRTVHRITGEACACTPYTDHPGTGEHHRSSGAIPVSGGNAGRNVESGAGRPGNLGAGTRVGPWREYHFDRWASAPTRPGVVLDPFGGTGTTALVAKALGRHGISVDRSADYCRLAEWRTNDPGELAKAMRVEKPAKQLDGQADIFDELGAA